MDVNKMAPSVNRTQTVKIDETKYPTLAEYTTPVKPASRPIIGREKEMNQLRAAMLRPELCNVILLAEAGTGKTALVQGVMRSDAKRIYREVNLAKMRNNTTDIVGYVKNLFDDAEQFCKNETEELVLFIDEFHQIVQLSAAAVEVLKPALADSGTRGIRVIAATTRVEFRKWIAPNQPLVERLQRIDLAEPNKETTVQILRQFAERYNVANAFYNNHLFEMIYEYTNRYVPANAQPRKSILLLDSMVGWHRATGRKIDMKLLADVIYDSEGVNVAFRVDALHIRDYLDKHVLAQKLATRSLESRLQICCANMNDPTKPMGSFLFTGPTGCGKGCTDDTLIPIWTEDGSVHHKRNGDLEIGDYVFNRKGEPVMVTGVFHRGLKDVYKVTLGDGRSIIVDGSHLWTWKYSKGHNNESFVTSNTEDLIRRGIIRNERNGRVSMNIWIPMNEAVQYPIQDYKIDPYVVGAMLGNGCLTSDTLEFSSADEYTVKKIARLIGAVDYKSHECNYTWVFVKAKNYYAQHRDSIIHQKELFEHFPEMYMKKSHEKRIPVAYKYGSVAQRWQLIQGLFDTDGSISSVKKDGERFGITYSSTSRELLQDIQDVLYSLGVSSSITKRSKLKDGIDTHYEYTLHVKSVNEEKYRFFSLPRKLEIAYRAKSTHKQRVKTFDLVGIRSIEKLPEQMPTTCIMVDDDEHLYQAGQYIVTHNTELTKQLAQVLFEDQRRLIRFDMTEYSVDSSVARFQKELTTKVWEHPYSIILLDEIEKACAPVTRELLQVLDDGRLIDENGREVSFLNSYIVMTTNAGSEIYETISQYNPDDDGSGEKMEEFQKLIENSIISTTGSNKFPPELLGRIDAIIPFQPLSEKTMCDIVRMKVKSIYRRVLEQHNLKLHVSEDIIQYLVKDKLDTHSTSGGARNVVRKLDTEVISKVSRFINMNKDKNITDVYVTVEGQMASDNKNQLKSKAQIKISV